MKSLLLDLFEDAIHSEDNIRENGSINWDFVCADIFMGLRDYGVDAYELQNEIQSQIESMIDEYMEFV